MLQNMYILENAYSPTLCLQTAETPSNWHISPNCWQNIYPIAIYKFNWHIFPNCWQWISNTNIYNTEAQFAGAQLARCQFGWGPVWGVEGLFSIVIFWTKTHYTQNVGGFVCGPLWPRGGYIFCCDVLSLICVHQTSHTQHLRGGVFKPFVTRGREGTFSIVMFPTLHL